MTHTEEPLAKSSTKRKAIFTTKRVQKKEEKGSIKVEKDKKDKLFFVEEWLDQNIYFSRQMNALYSQEPEGNYAKIGTNPTEIILDWLNNNYLHVNCYFKASLDSLCNDLFKYTRIVEPDNNIIMFNNGVYYNLKKHETGDIMDLGENRYESIFKRFDFEYMDEITENDMLWYKTSPLYEFFKESVKDESKIELIESASAHLLFGKNSRDNLIIYVYGQGGSGKGVYTNIISSLCKVATINENEFRRQDIGYLAPLIGADVILTPEIEKGENPKFIVFSKQLSGGDPVPINIKNKDIVELAGNETPRHLIVGEHKQDGKFSGGYKQRVVYIVFKGIKRGDPNIEIKNYHEKILKERRSIKIFQNICFHKVMDAYKNDTRYLTTNSDEIDKEQQGDGEFGRYDNPELYLLERYTEFNSHKNEALKKEGIGYTNKDIKEWMDELGKQYDLSITHPKRNIYRKFIEELYGEEFNKLGIDITSNTTITNLSKKAKRYYNGVVFFDEQQRLEIDGEKEEVPDELDTNVYVDDEGKKLISQDYDPVRGY
jgi:hypothetical protein